MKIVSTYKVKIRKTNGAFKNTVEQYRSAVDFFISVVLAEWKYISQISSSLDQQRAVEILTHRTSSNLCPSTILPKTFTNFPVIIRKAAITEAIGKVSSYKSNYANWEKNPKGQNPGEPKAGKVYPAI